MGWEDIRSLGLIIFLCGSLLLFSVKLGQYLDPPRPDQCIRVNCDSWMQSIADKLILAGVSLALIGIVVGYLPLVR
jgi:hypothetical protein